MHGRPVTIDGALLYNKKCVYLNQCHGLELMAVSQHPNAVWEM
jgi:hypothetical protein